MEYLIYIYISVAAVTFLPVLKVLIWGVKLHDGGQSFRESVGFSDKAKVQLEQHYSRIQGTLRFWKCKAVSYTRFHYYCMTWTLISSWLVPLISVYSDQIINGKWLVVAISSHVALSLSFYRGFNVSENMKVFRHGESEFYDLYRRLLDCPGELGANETEQIDEYFKRAELIRRYIRNAETWNFPSLDDMIGKMKIK